MNAQERIQELESDRRELLSALARIEQAAAEVGVYHNAPMRLRALIRDTVLSIDGDEMSAIRDEAVSHPCTWCHQRCTSVEPKTNKHGLTVHECERCRIAGTL